MIDIEKLHRLIRRFADAHILVVGDLMLDRFIWGKVDRISPEAPVPVVQVTRDCVLVLSAAYDPDVIAFQHRRQPLDGRLHQRIVADKPDELFGIQLSG